MDQLLDISDPLTRVQGLMKLMKGFSKDQGIWETELYDEVKIVSASKTEDNKAHCEFVFTPNKRMCNPMGSVHGGCIATALDMLTNITIAPCAARGFWDGISFSQSMNLMYMKPVKEGTEVRVLCEVVHIGRSSAVVRGVMKSKEGVILSTCEHLKTGRNAFKL